MRVVLAQLCVLTHPLLRAVCADVRLRFRVARASHGRHGAAERCLFLPFRPALSGSMSTPWRAVALGCTLVACRPAFRVVCAAFVCRLVPRSAVVLGRQDALARKAGVPLSFAHFAGLPAVCQVFAGSVPCGTRTFLQCCFCSLWQPSYCAARSRLFIGSLETQQYLSSFCNRSLSSVTQILRGALPLPPPLCDVVASYFTGAPVPLAVGQISEDLCILSLPLAYAPLPHSVLRCLTVVSLLLRAPSLSRSLRLLLVLPRASGPSASSLPRSPCAWHVRCLLRCLAPLARCKPDPCPIPVSFTGVVGAAAAVGGAGCVRPLPGLSCLAVP